MRVSLFALPIASFALFALSPSPLSPLSLLSSSPSSSSSILVSAAPINPAWVVQQVETYNLTAALLALTTDPIKLSDSLRFLSWNTVRDVVEAVGANVSKGCGKVVGKKNEWVKVAVACGGLDVWDAFQTPLPTPQLSNASYISHTYLDPVCSVRDECHDAMKRFWGRAYAACANETVLDSHALPALVVGLLNQTVANYSVPAGLPDWANISSPAYALNLTVTDVHSVLSAALDLVC
ncbi:hypothetical protein HDU93_005832, partial [Gonapodya sp. JEL0774]